MTGKASVKGPFHLEIKGSTIQYGYKKCGTHARVFSQTHTQEQQEWINITDKESKKRGVGMERSKAGT